MEKLSLEFLRALVSLLPETKEKPMPNKITFYVKSKVFATYNLRHFRSCVKLSAEDQAIFTNAGKGAVVPVPNSYGKLGWTLLLMDSIDPKLYQAAVTMAYCQAAPKILADIVLNLSLENDF
jgi:hypothetical protein